MEPGLPSTAREYAADAERRTIGTTSAEKAIVSALLAIVASIQEQGLFAEHPDD